MSVHYAAPGYEALAQKQSRFRLARPITIYNDLMSLEEVVEGAPPSDLAHATTLEGRAIPEWLERFVGSIAIVATVVLALTSSLWWFFTGGTFNRSCSDMANLFNQIGDWSSVAAVVTLALGILALILGSKKARCDNNRRSHAHPRGTQPFHFARSLLAIVDATS